MAAVISLPIFAIYTLRYANEAREIRDYRLMTTLIASVPLALIVFFRTHIADKDRVRLLAKSEQSLQNLQRLQAQMVQTEKLVSLGQLAAGAAHEINNPLAAILGYSDLLADDPSLPEKTRATAAKIRDQARRTKTLVGNLLSFARPGTARTHAARYQHRRNQRHAVARTGSAYRQDQSRTATGIRASRGARRRQPADASFLQHHQQRR
jgi:signal transduction histidine kinase